jgi:hypothetical protein
MDIHTGQLLNTFIGHTDCINSVAFSCSLNCSIDTKLKEYTENLK